MTDWKTKYETLQKTHEDLLRRFNRMEPKYRYVSQRLVELEDQIFHGRVSERPASRARKAAERFFGLDGHVG